MRSVTILVAVLAALAGGVAAGRAAAAPLDSVYECTDADGNRSYQNVPDSSSCRRLDGLVASVPTPERSRVRRAHPRRPYVMETNFPRISPATQRARDLGRHRLLEDELHAEEGRLARLRAEYGRMQSLAATGGAPGGSGDRAQQISDDIERARENITSLHQELLAGNRY